MTYPSEGAPVQLGDNDESAAMVQQARNSAGGFDYGSDRAIGSPPNWASQESEQLYRGATQNNDPATAEATGQAWRNHGEELHQAANDLYNAISELGNVWIGKGASSAQGALVGIANSSQQAGDAAHTMAARLAQQAAAAAEVKKMPAPKTFDPAQHTAAMLAGGPAAMCADMKKQSDEAKAVHAQQVRYFNAYTQSLSEVDHRTPSFGPASLGLPPDGNIGATHASSVGGASGIAGGVSVGSVGAVAAGFSEGGRGGSGFGVRGGQGAAGGPGGPVGGLGGGLPGGETSGAGPGASSGVPTSSSGGAAALGAGIGLAATGLGAAAGRAVLGKGNKSGAKQSDATATASTDNAEQQQGHVGPQNQGLINSGGTIGGSQAAPPPTMGGGGAQPEEDQEHNRASFLVEADPDEAFGANVATAQPVIGAWDEDEDD
ncbi:hypothetical protein [Amycolatopsis pigmentata]|uniref:PPE family protein n=1 Tax=Amycolatopsis pigmentata TaxID=450801 RepID=A0ABW5FRE3_9PSEU